jgi:alpha-tubulin suppressor-like RCC1 family protein
MQLPLHVLLLVGSFFVVAIRGSQFVHTWGVQARGRTIPGRIAAINDTFLPQNDPIKSITVGMFHAALLTESGRVFGWGQHEKGQLGSR